MSAEIGLAFQAPSDHSWLPILRGWTTEIGQREKFFAAPIPVTPFSSIDDALRWRAESPSLRPLVTVGFACAAVLAAESSQVPGEDILVQTPDAANSPAARPTASFQKRGQVVVCHDLFPHLRKSLIRSRLRERFEIRPPLSENELSGYFSLRYAVWQQIGFLREESKKTRIQWEIDYWDRTAVPWCILNLEGKVVATARLVKNYGSEEQPYVSRIQRLLDSANDRDLTQLFKFPNAIMRPFDVLEEFPGFGEHFRPLIRNQVMIGELGRVAVEPEFRGQCLSEALVDTILSYAEEKSFSYIFLACREELGSLYAKCGFAPVEGLRSAKFFNIELPSIVMQRTFQPLSSQVAA